MQAWLPGAQKHIKKTKRKDKKSKAKDGPIKEGHSKPSRKDSKKMNQGSLLRMIKGKVKKASRIETAPVGLDKLISTEKKKIEGEGEQQKENGESAGNSQFLRIKDSGSRSCRSFESSPVSPDGGWQIETEHGSEEEAASKQTTPSIAVDGSDPSGTTLRRSRSHSPPKEADVNPQAARAKDIKQKQQRRAHRRTMPPLKEREMEEKQREEKERAEKEEREKEKRPSIGGAAAPDTPKKLCNSTPFSFKLLFLH